MKYYWNLVLICFCLKAVYSQRPLEDKCPEAEDVEPCTCSEGFDHTRRLFCRNVNDIETLRRVFQNAEGYYYNELRIFNSTLQYFPHEIVEKTSAKVLILMSVTLVQMFDAPPHGVRSIVRVILDNVRVSRNISWSIFQGFTNIDQLTVENIPIGILGPSFSQYMSKSLESVFFRNVKINEIKQGALSQLPNLKFVRFTNCGLTSLTRDIFPRPWIKGSSLSFIMNRISSIPEDLFTDMPNVAYIDFENNFISELPESAFQRSSVNVINLRGNPLKCDCQMRWLLKKESVKNYNGECASPKRLEGKPLQNLTTSDFQCKENTLIDLN